MKKVKDSLARILYQLLIWIVKFLPAQKGDKRLLIIKLDEIGDYMLFRGYLKYFRQSPKYAGYRITLLGNAAWKPIFDEYDRDTVDDTIWVTKKQFNRSLSYRFGLLRLVRNRKFSDVVNCVYSRFFVLEDGFAFVATGISKIAYTPETFNTNRGENGFSMDSRIYTELVDASTDGIVFEMLRNQRYLSQVLKLDLPVENRLAVHDTMEKPDAPYFVVFIGAGNMIDRKWDIDNFMQCASYVYERTGWRLVLCGAPPDVEDGNIFAKKYPGPLSNYVAKTSLPQLLELLAGGKMMLSVDTGPVHMAAATGCPVVGLFSGVHYARYAPYPSVVSEKFFPVYADKVDALVASGSQDVYNPFIMQNRFIKLIPVKKVIDTLEGVINGLLAGDR